MAELVFKDEVYQIVGAGLEVYWQLGRGQITPRSNLAPNDESNNPLRGFQSARASA